MKTTESGGVSSSRGLLQAGRVRSNATPSDVDAQVRRLVAPIFDAPYLWTGANRIMVIYRSTMTRLLGALFEVMPAVSIDKALREIGYEAGVRSAEHVLEQDRSGDFFENARRCMVYNDFCGYTCFEIECLEFDWRRKHFLCVVRMTSSIEADGFLQSSAAKGGRRVCAMQAGYLSGAMTRLAGMNIRFDEHVCRAECAESCQMVGEVERKSEERQASLAGVSRKGANVLDEMRQAPASYIGDPALGLAGASPALQSLWSRVGRIAKASVPILVTGETGVGKDVLARAAHSMSGRQGKPFVAINCGALHESLIDAELFGVEKGAFTGATESRRGRFENAHLGTIFLDEIGLLSRHSQGKLLRVLEDGTFDRVGGAERRVDVRIIAATNLDLLTEVRKGRFREDLYYRICAINLHIPPLRERKEDILPIAYVLLEKLENELHCKWQGLSRTFKSALINYDFPGNVRELRQIVTAAASFTEDGSMIDLPALSAAGIRLERGSMRGADDASAGAVGTLGELSKHVLGGAIKMKDVQRHLIEDALAASKGNLAAAARLLGLSRRQIEYRVNGQADTKARRHEAVGDTE